MLSNIQKLAQSGSKDMAEQMLSELKDILDRLQTGNFADNAQQQRAGRMMKDLSDIVSNQQKLLDETFTAKREQSATAARRSDAVRGEPARASPWSSARHEHGAAFEQRRQRRSKAAMKGQGESGGQGGRGNPAGDGPAAAARPAPRSALQARRPAAGAARQAAKPDRPLPHRRREPAEEFEDAGEAMSDAKEAARREQSRPRHAAAEPGARSIAQRRPVDGRADDGERRSARPAKAQRQ